MILKRFGKVIAWVVALLVGLVGIIVVMAFMMIPSQQSFDKYSLPEHVQVLSQGWDADVRQQVSYASFGSMLLTHDVFINLSLPDGTLLSDPKLMDSLGFIPQNVAVNNPSGLPVGFALDYDEKGTAWVGLSCAACHTGMISYKGQEILIDGGPALLNFTAFEQTIYDALKHSLDSVAAFDALALRMKLETSEQKQALKAYVESRTQFFGKKLQVNKVTVPYGYGRLDAFGRIFNAVTTTALGVPANRHEPNAPVSIPMLWDASHLDLVQWNASAPNKNPGPLGQNVTTVLAVYGDITIEEDGMGYHSSANLPNLGYIQSRYYDLMSPVWPEHILGAIDQAKAKRGGAIYADKCVKCHELIDRDQADRKLRAVVVDQKEIKTDPFMARNFATLMCETGPLDGQKAAVVVGPRFGAEAPTIDVVVNAAVGAMIRQPINAMSAFLAENRNVYEAKTDFTREAYKARSLNGVWASGPFLHNGSVPSLYDLLQSADKRPETFHVGSREMDTQKVGLQSTETYRSELFDTRLPGNSNAGHEFAADLSEAERWELVEYLKTL